MLRIATLMLCLLLAAAAAGRYRAEVSVREAREAVEMLEHEKGDEARRIQVLRAELAWLESPERLVKIAQEKTILEPMTGAQLMSPVEFVTAFAGDSANDRAARAEAIAEAMHLSQNLVQNLRSVPTPQ